MDNYNAAIHIAALCLINKMLQSKCFYLKIQQY